MVFNFSCAGKKYVLALEKAGATRDAIGWRLPVPERFLSGPRERTGRTLAYQAHRLGRERTTIISR